MKTSLRMGILGLSTMAMGLSFQLAFELTQSSMQSRDIASTNYVGAGYPVRSMQKTNKVKYVGAGYPVRDLSHKEEKKKEEKVSRTLSSRSEIKKEKEQEADISPIGLENTGVPVDYKVEYKKEDKKIKEFAPIGMANTGIPTGEKKDKKEIADITPIGLENTGIPSDKEEKKITDISPIGLANTGIPSDEEVEFDADAIAAMEEELKNEQVELLQASLCEKENELDKLAEELEETRESLDEVLARLDEREDMKEKKEKKKESIAPAMQYNMNDMTQLFGTMLASMMANIQQNQIAAQPQYTTLHNPLQDIVVENLLYRAYHQKQESILPKSNYHVTNYNYYNGSDYNFGNDQHRMHRMPQQEGPGLSARSPMAPQGQAQSLYPRELTPSSGITIYQ